EEVELAGFLHVAGRELCVRPSSPEDVHPSRATDRAAGILIEDETVDRLPYDLTVRQLHRARGPDEAERAARKDARIGGNRAARRERSAEAPDRPAGAPAEEDEGLVEPEDSRLFLGMLVEPFPERPHRHGLGRDLAFLDEQPADAPIWIAVGRG